MRARSGERKRKIKDREKQEIARINKMAGTRKETGKRRMGPGKAVQEGKQKKERAAAHKSKGDGIKRAKTQAKRNEKVAKDERKRQSGSGRKEGTKGEKRGMKIGSTKDAWGAENKLCIRKFVADATNFRSEGRDRGTKVDVNREISYSLCGESRY